MYLSYWGLSSVPFQAAADARHYVATAGHHEALSRMDFLANEGGQFGLLLGPAGTGKSLLLQVFGRRLRRQGWAVAQLDRVPTDPSHLLFLLARQWEPRVTGNESLAQLWEATIGRLDELRLEGVRPLVLIDNLDQWSTETQTVLYQLLSCQVASAARLGTMVSLQGSGLSLMHERLVDLADLRMELEPWNERETTQFLTARLEAAGRDEPTFDDGALLRLHELTEGVPRRVCQLAQLVLAAGAGQSLNTIDEATVEAVCYELFSSPGSAPTATIELGSQAAWSQ